LRFWTKWNERFTSSAGYSLVNIDNSNGQLPSAFIKAVTRWEFAVPPHTAVTMGGEFQFGRRVNFTDGF